MAQILQITNYLEQLSYFGIFIYFSLVGYIIPFPEEVSLAIVGYISAISSTNVYIVIIVAMAGLFLGDCVLFTLSRHGSKFILKLKKKFLKKKIEKLSSLIVHHEGKTIFISRFMVGVRMMGPIIAGSHKTKFTKFVFFDVLALIVYVPTLVLLGYHFHNRILVSISNIVIIRHIIAAITLVFIGYWITKYAEKRYLEH